MNQKTTKFITNFFIAGLMFATILLLIDIISNKHIAYIGFLAGSLVLGSVYLWYNIQSDSDRQIFVKHNLIGGVFWVIILLPLLLFPHSKHNALLVTLLTYLIVVILYYIILRYKFNNGNGHQQSKYIKL